MFALAPSAEARSPARVLVLQSFDETPLTFGAVAEALRAELNRRIADPLNFVEVSLQPTGFRTTPEAATVAYLRSAFSRSDRPDLIVTIGAPAALFLQRHRRELFQDIPIIHSMIDQRFLRGSAPLSNSTTVAVKNDISGWISNILQVLPDTTHLFVIVGASPLGQSWREFVHRELVRFEPPLATEWSLGMSFDELLAHAASLPPRSAILYIFFNVDSQGAAINEERVLAKLHDVSKAPIFGTQSTQLGRGIVGGPLMPVNEVERRTVDAAVRVLRGDDADRIRPAVVTQVSPFVFDWRELRRWGIAESRLPRGSVVRLREPSQWERNKWLIVSATSIVVVEALLIVALVVNRVKRGRVQERLDESEQRFGQLASVAPVMIWMSGPDKGCTDVNRTWLEFTGRTLEQELGDGWLESVHPHDAPELFDTYSRAFDRHEPFRAEYRLRRADGEYRWVLDCGVPRFAPDGLFAGYIGSALDVTEQKAAHAALSELSGRLIEAQERERRRIARELHDDIGQRLALLTVELDQMDKAAPRNITQVVRDLVTQSTSLARDIQSLSHRLHSSKLEYLGLASAAASFCKEASSQFGVPIGFRHENVPDGLGPDTALAVFRVLQEAITNSLRHAGARHIAAVLRGSSYGVELEVTDTGCGFDVTEARRHGGLGLISMEERMKLIGGDVEVRSEHGGGTTIWAFAPLTTARHQPVAAAQPQESAEQPAVDLVV
ncbi:MAG TPA: PAS domain-containing protein [Vicinamibacterales bacterium]|nr:PAS domain-containing protein [Vicinamibacterales bacterium]